MVLPSPNLTLTVTPPGGSPVNYTSNLAWAGTSQTITITQNFGRQGDTATFVLYDEYTASPNFHIIGLSQIKLVDNALGQTLFAGVVTTPGLLQTSPISREWILTCTDYTFYADNIIVQGIFDNQTADSIAVALTRQANCGITAAKIAAGGFVAPAPSLQQVVVNYSTLSGAWRTLAQLASSSTAYGWYVDELLRWHFFDASTALPSGATFTTTPTAGGAGSTTEGHIAVDSTFAYQWDGTSIRNRILVQGATQTIATNLNGPSTDTWRGDGVTTSWALRYTPTGTPSLTLNGVSTSVTTVSGGGTTSAAWSIQQNAIGAWYLIAAVAPAVNTIIRLWYSYLVPITAQANDYQSQAAFTGPNGGVYETYILDTSLSTMPMALARAQRERTEYAFPAERAVFNTTPEFFGWLRAGQTFQYVNRFVEDATRGYALGVNDTFLCMSNTVTFADGGYRTMNVTGVRI